MICDFSIYINFSPCMHRRVVLDTSGEMHFSEGECWDDIQERLLCLDCMEYVTEAEVRAAQSGIPLRTNKPQREVYHDHD